MEAGKRNKLKRHVRSDSVDPSGENTISVLRTLKRRTAPALTMVPMLLLLLLTLSFVGLGPGTNTASADADLRRVVVGADLTEEQIASVYELFGMRRGDIQELRLTNAQEHAVLDGYLADNIIGTKSMSCVYLELLPQGSGITVTEYNISWLTPEMFSNAFTTAGISDARVVVAAPFPVSGTAALAGIYLAYEDMTGAALDATARDASTQELTVTGELADEIGSSNSESIIAELKQMLDRTVNMTDEELKTEIRRIASDHHVRLTDAQVKQLQDLCRTLEKLKGGASLAERAGDLQSTLDKVSEAKDEVVGFWQTLKHIFETVRDFIERLIALFQ